MVRYNCQSQGIIYKQEKKPFLLIIIFTNFGQNTAEYYDYHIFGQNLAKDH